MCKLTGAALLLVVGAALGSGASDQPIIDAEKAWAQAVVKGDAAALEKIFSDRLIYAHSTGVIENKQQYIDRLKTGAQKYEAIIHESTRVVDYGDSAVAHSTVRMSGVSNGREFNDHVMMLHLWVKQDGVWRLAAHQTTKLAQ